MFLMNYLKFTSSASLVALGIFCLDLSVACSDTTKSNELPSADGGGGNSSNGGSSNSTEGQLGDCASFQKEQDGGCPLSHCEFEGIGADTLVRCADQEAKPIPASTNCTIGTAADETVLLCQDKSETALSSCEVSAVPNPNPLLSHLPLIHLKCGNEIDVSWIQGLVVKPHLALGEEHSCVLMDSGKVRCWGRGMSGQTGYALGAEAIGDDELPKSVGDVKLLGKVVQLTAGYTHTCALYESGDVSCWGGGEGSLGYPNITSYGFDNTPDQAGYIDVGGKAIQIAAGFTHSCALLESGAVRCWGRNEMGQLGYGNTTTIGDDETPATAGDVNIGGKATQITVGGGHSCALLESGAVRCWGYNAWGQLGYGNIDNIGDDETPASAGDVNVGARVLHIVANVGQTCALLESGAVRCWGQGEMGKLGYGNTDNIGDDETPVSAGDVNIGGNVVQLTAGEYHTCALMDSGAVRCWGNAKAGALGYGNANDIGDDESPTSAGDIDLGGQAVYLASGGGHNCAMLASGAVRCWGYGANGQLGYGSSENIGVANAPSSAGDVQYR